MKRRIPLALLLALAACGGAPGPDEARAEIETRGLSADGAGLCRAALSRDPALVKLFLAAGVDPNGFEDPRHAPLFLAARSLDDDTVAALIAGGARAEGLPTVLAGPAARGRRRLVERLLDAGAPVDGVDQLGRTALAGAAEEGHAEVVRVLLDRGAAPDGAPRGDHRQATPLIVAAERGELEVVEALVAAGAALDRLGGRPRGTALTAAAAAGHADVVRALLAAGADRHAAVAGGLTALGAAQRAGHEECAALLR